jgi:DNA gyrase/topoisomerase IV subunit A
MCGLLDIKIYQDMKSDRVNDVIEAYYKVLIDMVQMKDTSEALMEGQGNFGGNGEPAAFPPYTACRLTLLGERLAEKLFEERPDLHADYER